MNDREIEFLKAVCEVVGEKMAAREAEQAAALSEVKAQLESVTAELTALKSAPVPEAPELPDVEALVQEAVAQIPAPQDGQSVTVDDVRPIIEEAVRAEVEKMPVPEAPELPDVEALVQEAVAQIPTPQDGQSVTVDDVRPMIEEATASAVSEAVKEAVKSLPVPEVPPLPDVEQLVAEVASRIEIPAPVPGADGKDALQIEILPDIDEEKSYARGSYATFNGGLWRSFEKTHGKRGWECLVNGVSGIDIEQKSPREFTITARLADGSQEQKSFAVPVMIYKGVFHHGESYSPGDTVTWGGSLWHCNEATGDKPGENGSKGWQLAVKRGRDAK